MISRHERTSVATRVGQNRVGHEYALAVVAQKRRLQIAEAGVKRTDVVVPQDFLRGDVEDGDADRGFLARPGRSPETIRGPVDAGEAGAVATEDPETRRLALDRQRDAREFTVEDPVPVMPFESAEIRRLIFEYLSCRAGVARFPEERNRPHVPGVLVDTHLVLIAFHLGQGILGLIALLGRFLFGGDGGVALTGGIAP